MILIVSVLWISAFHFSLTYKARESECWELEGDAKENSLSQWDFSMDDISAIHGFLLQELCKADRWSPLLALRTLWAHFILSIFFTLTIKLDSCFHKESGKPKTIGKENEIHL